MPQAKSKAQRGRPTTKGEKRTAAIAFRTTASTKMLAERLARGQGRSLANYLETLIWNETRGLDRAASGSRQQQLTA